MSERSRNDLYYIERLSGEPMALYPDGSVGKLKEKNVKVDEISTSRRPDRERVTKKTEKHLVQTALFGSASEYLAYVNKRRAKVQKKYQHYGEDKNWSLEDMPDNIIHQFETWKNSLDVPSRDDMLAAATELIASEEAAQNETVQCPDCQAESEYACYSCGYARSYFKYPLVRMVSDDGSKDVPFDAARLIASDPDALRFETRTKFDWQGKMAAEQVAVLCSNKLSGLYMNQDKDEFHIEEADALNTEITFTVAAWQEEDYMQGRRQTENLASKDPRSLVETFQQHVATRVVREQTDMPRYQELYTEFMSKIRKLGGASLVVALRGRYRGMGESDVEMLVSETQDPLALTGVWATYDTKALIKETAAALDEVKSIDRLRPYLYRELMQRYGLSEDDLEDIE